MTTRVLLPTLRPLRGYSQRFTGPFPALATTRHSSTSSSSSSSSPTHPCPSCGTPVPLASSPCPSCSTLLPIPSGISHHSILSLSTPIPRAGTTATTKSGLPSEYDIPAELSTLPAHGYDLDARDLRQRMLGRQRELHPDKFASRGDRVVQMARELSGRVNKAYDVLGNPLKRAEYILSVHGLRSEETDSLTDPTLLAEILEAREELEEAASHDEVDEIRKANHEKVEETIAAIKEAFSNEPPDFEGARTLAIQLKYWLGLEAAAKEWTPK